MCDSDARILSGLPHAEMRAGRVLDHSHTPEIHDVKRRHHHGATELLGLASGLIGAAHRDVNHPVWRHTLRALICSQCVSGGCIATLYFKDRVELAWPDRRDLLS